MAVLIISYFGDASYVIYTLLASVGVERALMENMACLVLFCKTQNSLVTVPVPSKVT